MRDLISSPKIVDKVQHSKICTHEITVPVILKNAVFMINRCNKMIKNNDSVICLNERNAVML